MKSTISFLLAISVIHISFASSPELSAQADPYARYTTPGECAMALNRLERRFWRDKRPDTIYAGPLGKAPQRSSVQEIKKCVSKFSVEKTPERDLVALGYAYLRAEEFSKAEQAFQRLVAIKASKQIAERANALVQIIDIYSDARPIQIAKAKTYMAKLDVLGVPAASERMVGHLNIYRAARMADSVILVEEEAKAAIKASNEIGIDSVKRQRATTSFSARAALAYFYNRKGDGTNSVATLEQGRIDLGAIRGPLKGAGASTIARYKLIGKPAPRIQATQWYNDEASKVHPATDKVSTVTFVSHGCGSDCYQGYSISRRLKAHNFGANTNLVFVNRTEGYYRQSLVSPGKEFVLGAKYFLDYLQLPITLGTWQTDYGRKPDGRLDVLSNPNEEAYHPLFDPPMQTYVIDRNGNVRFISNMLQRYEVEIQNVLKEIY